MKVREEKWEWGVDKILGKSVSFTLGKPVSKIILDTFKNVYPSVNKMWQWHHPWRSRYVIIVQLIVAGKIKFARGSGATGEEAVKNCENNIARILKAHGLMPKESEVA